MSEHIRARALTIVDAYENDVVTMGLSGNNQRRAGRLYYEFHGSYPAEIEIEPGPEVARKGNIVSQVMLWGPPTPDGTKRNRLTLSITADDAGGLSGVLDSTTNSPSGSTGQAASMPLVINVGESKGQYVVLFADGRIKFKHDGMEYTTTIGNIVNMLALNE